MSANNEIVIYKKGKKFIVGHLDVDCGWHKNMYLLAAFIAFSKVLAIIISLRINRQFRDNSLEQSKRRNRF